MSWGCGDRVFANLIVPHAEIRAALRGTTAGSVSSPVVPVVQIGLTTYTMRRER